jgi:hypothetical protein
MRSPVLTLSLETPNPSNPMPQSAPEEILNATPDQILMSALQRQAKSERPAIATIAAALQQMERTAKRRGSIEYSSLLGTWRLVLTTRSNRSKSSKNPQKITGQWMPDWVKIEITYENGSLTSSNSSPPLSEMSAGIVRNQVTLGALKLTLSGPTLLHPNNILAFDFTHLTLQLGKLTFYRGNVRGGTAQNAQFYQQSLKTQAFFRFFWITPTGLAARGRGGGLAIWSKTEIPII